MLTGALATVLALVVLVETERLFPPAAAAELARVYWQGVHPGTDPLQQAQAYAQFYLFVLSKEWILWLVPLGGIVITSLCMRSSSEEEITLYLQRLHDQERQMKELFESAAKANLKWDGARESMDKVLENARDLWLVVGRDGRISRGNAAARQFLKVEQLAGHELQRAWPWLPQTALYAGLAKAMKGETWHDEFQTPATIDEGSRHWQGMVWPWGGELALWLRDISAQFSDSSVLQNSAALLRQVVEQSTRPLAILDAQGAYLHLSPHFDELLGLPPGSLARGDSHVAKAPGVPPDLALHMQKLKPGEVVGNDSERVTINGREEVISWHLRQWADAFGRPGGYILTLLNQSELHRLRAQTTEASERENSLAYSDPLTGLPNRQLFNDRLNVALAVAHRQLGKLALLFLDLDGFKKVNDTLGHDAGDLLLKQVAARLQAQVRATDTVARLGGDEFTIILAIRDRSDAERVAEKLLAVIRAPYKLNGQDANIGTSIGIAMFPADGQQAADLIRKADAAMYEAKQAGKNTFRFATKEVVVVAE